MQDAAAATEISARTVELPLGRSRPLLASFLPLRIRRFDRCMATALVSLILLEAALSKFLALALPPIGSMLPWTECKIVAALAIFYCLHPSPRLAETNRLLLWSAIWTNPLQVLIELAARSPFPLVDRQLAAIDHCLHIDTAAIHYPASVQPWMTFSILIYVMFLPLLFASVVLPCLYGFPRAARRFVVGVIIGLAIGALLFVFFPAIGPWSSEAMSPSSVQLTMGNYLALLKARAPMQMDLGRSAIVSFPSEHVIVALLAARALGVIRPLRTWIWIVSALVCCSTLTTGWHYAIDVIGGIVVAVLSGYLADNACALLEKDRGREVPALTFHTLP